MIDIEIEDERWREIPNADGLASTAALSTLKSAHPREGGDPGFLSEGARVSEKAWVPAFEGMSGSLMILLTDDETVRELNGRFRGKDKPTNVLSFPAIENPEGFIGDIALAFETCAREADEQGKPLAHHLQHLVAHGVLHLVGYDHESDAQAQAMEALEREILSGLGVPDPYAAGDQGHHG
ncbi:MAG TPA: rRNA maturation RNase YbeY [Caulobacteraceae bacterium]